MPRTAQRNAAVPAAVRPAGKGGKRTLCGYELVLNGTLGKQLCGFDPQTQIITMHPATFAWVKNDNGALQALVHEKAEAVRTMQTRMVDLSKYAAPTVPTNRSKPIPQATGIKALCAEIAHLVADMSAPDVSDQTAIIDMATRYGRLRDTMADLRAAFLEAEGMFETAQNLLITKLGDDE